MYSSLKRRNLSSQWYTECPIFCRVPPTSIIWKLCFLLISYIHHYFLDIKWKNSTVIFCFKNIPRHFKIMHLVGVREKLLWINDLWLSRTVVMETSSYLYKLVTMICFHGNYLFTRLGPNAGGFRVNPSLFQ